MIADFSVLSSSCNGGEMKEKKTTKEIIIEKSIELFSAKGYNGTSMEDIAGAVGIRKASLYSHHSGKEEIFTTIFDQIVDEYMTFLENLTRDDASVSAADKLHAIFREYAHYNRTNARMKFWDRFYYFPPEPLKDYIYEKTAKTGEYMVARFRVIFERGVKRKEFSCADTSDTVMAFHFLLMGFVMSTTYVETDVDRDIDRCVRVFLNGLRTK